MTSFKKFRFLSEAAGYRSRASFGVVCLLILYAGIEGWFAVKISEFDLIPLDEAQTSEAPALLALAFLMKILFQIWIM